MLDRQTLLLLTVGLCVANGIFSPFLALAIPVTAALMPELFPRTIATQNAAIGASARGGTIDGVMYATGCISQSVRRLNQR